MYGCGLSRKSLFCLLMAARKIQQSMKNTDKPIAETLLWMSFLEGNFFWRWFFEALRPSPGERRRGPFIRGCAGLQQRALFHFAWQALLPTGAF